MSEARVPTNVVILPKRVVPQPLPHLHPGGDCGACVLAGLVGVSLPEAYEIAERKVEEGFSWHSMRQALYHLKARGRVDRFICDVPFWRGGAIDAMATFGYPAWTQALEWFSYLRMAFDAGYYGIACVNHAKAGPFRGPDHFVLLAGAREMRPPPGEGGGIDQDILVSCSSRATPDEEWVEVRDFLKERGGYNLFLARPT